MPSSELSEMFCYVYVLHSERHNRYYVGMTENLARRLAEHNSKKNRSTKPYTPWKVVYYEAHRHKIDAARREEKYLKTTQGKQALRRMIRTHFDQKGYY